MKKDNTPHRPIHSSAVNQDLSDHVALVIEKLRTTNRHTIQRQEIVNMVLQYRSSYRVEYINQCIRKYMIKYTAGENADLIEDANGDYHFRAENMSTAEMHHYLLQLEQQKIRNKH